jgi:hypothetical protein
MEATMARGVTQLVIGAALVAAIVGGSALNSKHRPNEEVAFLERLAVTVERAQVLAPETRDYVSSIAGKHQSALSDPRLDLRRQKALARITAITDAPHTDARRSSPCPDEKQCAQASNALTTR